jgi:predicted secreted acid phosphatase
MFMHMRSIRIFSLFFFLVLSATFTVQTAAWQSNIHDDQLPNLGELKTKLVAYHDCTDANICYATDLQKQAGIAMAYLQQRTAHKSEGEKLAVVLDIDETSLSNWEIELKDDFGYLINDQNAWIKEAKAPAIAPTLQLFNEAAKKGVSIFFITGRPKAQEEDTIKNLHFAGYRNWSGLALREPHSPSQTVIEFKSSERKKIADAGFHIILNIGDQFSDLNGLPQAELSVKLPNPFYYIP